MLEHNNGNILAFILYFCDEGFRKLRETPPNIDSIDVHTLLEVAARNKLSYYVLKKAIEEENLSHQIFRDVVTEGDRNLVRQEQTLKFISSVLGEIGADFLVIKSYKALPYITVDIDIMLRQNDYHRAVSAFEARGASQVEGKHRLPLPGFLERRLSRVRGAGLEKEGLLEIDVYQDTTWTGWLCLDNEFIWKEPRSLDICGVRCAIPNREADLLLSLAHVIFCHGSIHLLDFLYMNSLLQEDLDFESIFREAKKYGWERPLRALISRIQELHRVLHSNQEIQKSAAFPSLIPFNIVLSSYLGVTRASKEGLGSSLSNWINTVFKLATMLVYR